MTSGGNEYDVRVKAALDWLETDPLESNQRIGAELVRTTIPRCENRDDEWNCEDE